jgi:hypothetical protein
VPDSSVYAGIAVEPGQADFWVCETHPEWSSFERQVAAREGSPHRYVPVPCLTFGSILEQYGVPYYLKVDIEGSDLLCVQALRTQPDLPRYVSLEVYGIDEPVQTRGRWLTGAEVRQVFHHYQDRSRRGVPSVFWTGKDFSFWADLHARRED